MKPLKQQTDFNLVKDLLKRDTEELVECYTDITRILKPGRALVIQIKDIKFGDFYVPISGWHLELAIRNGLRLITQFHGYPQQGGPKPEPSLISKKGK